MPDGFEPHNELARIYNLRDLMLACRERTPKIMTMIDDMLDDDTVAHSDKIKLFEMVFSRGFGKPRQQISINAGDAPTESVRTNPVKIMMPDNGRQSLPLGPIVDAQEVE